MMKKQKFPLGFFPTPLHQLENLSKQYPDYRVFIKRDDHTGLATGGNKTRKLEYLIGEALAQNADTIITAGALQSNHCRQTAAACAMAGLECHLLLRGEPEKEITGNLLLSKILGANLHFTQEDKKGPGLANLAQELKSEGRKPYVIPYGGSNLCGALGYVEAVAELKMQLDQMELALDYIFFASSSGAMQAGLMLGMTLYKLNATLMPVCIDKEETGEKKLETEILNILNEGCKILNIRKKFDLHEIPLLREFNDAGYGVVTNNEKEAILTLGRSEGIILDPVYTGRAFYAMLHHLKNKTLKTGSNVLFWHTGGIPANFFYAKEIAPE